jgi:hypothetical protein
VKLEARPDRDFYALTGLYRERLRARVGRAGPHELLGQPPTLGGPVPACRQPRAERAGARQEPALNPLPGVPPATPSPNCQGRPRRQPLPPPSPPWHPRRRLSSPGCACDVSMRPCCAPIRRCAASRRAQCASPASGGGSRARRHPLAAGPDPTSAVLMAIDAAPPHRRLLS